MVDVRRFFATAAIATFFSPPLSLAHTSWTGGPEKGSGEGGGGGLELNAARVRVDLPLEGCGVVAIVLGGGRREGRGQREEGRVLRKKEGK